MPKGHRRFNALNWSLPQVMRIETMHGQATQSGYRAWWNAAGEVPEQAWSLGWSRATLERRLTDLEWIFTMVMPESITYPTPTRRM